VDATIRLSLDDIKAGDPSLRRAIPMLLNALEGARDLSPEDERLAELLAEAEASLPGSLEGGPSGEAQSGAPSVSFRGSPGSIGILIEALREKDGSVRAKAARALGGLGPAAREAIPVLLGALEDRARALGRIGAAAAEGLAAAVNDKDPVVRQIAADALKRIIRRKREIKAAD
jgi:HEAT repeat protein